MTDQFSGGANLGLGEWIRLRRRALDLTQDELASRVGCSKITIRKIEAEERRPSKQVAERLADILGIAPAEQAAFIRFVRGDPRAALPARSAQPQASTPWQAPASNLPAALPALIGREAELAEIRSRLLTPGLRLLTLIGPGGIGKTHLAMAAAQSASEFRNGVYFVPLAPLASPDFIVSAIAAALRLPLTGAQDPRTQLFNYLSDKQALLVMDNFEHLLAGAGLLADLLAHAPALKLIVTSRERLNLHEEWLLEIRGLSVPEADRISEAESFSAVQLLLQCARRIQPGFALLADETPCAIRICRLVDGMPLGVELAAAWVRSLTCREIAAEIERNLSFLSASARDRPERHRSLQAVFEHSWNLLTLQEQTVFRKLSVFRGGFKRQAAEQIAGVSLPLLSALMDKSLIRRAESGRFELHELLRQFAHDKLVQAGELEQTQNLHLAYFLDLAEAAELKLRTAEQQLWLKQLEAEHDNLRAALGWSLKQAGGSEDCLRLVGALMWFWYRRGYLGEGRQWLGETLELSAQTVTVVRAKALYSLGVLALYHSDNDAAALALNESIAVYEAAGDQHGLAYALAFLGAVRTRLNDLESARRGLVESVAAFRAMDDQWGLALALDFYGDVLRRSNQYSAAGGAYRESLQLFRELNDDWGISVPLLDLGVIAYIQQDFAQAHHLFEEGLAIGRSLGDKWLIIYFVNFLGEVARCQNDYDQAEVLYDEALRLGRELGGHSTLPYVIHNQGHVALYRNDPRRAKALFTQSFQLFQAQESQPGMLDCVAGFAGIARLTGQIEKAARLFGALDAALAKLGTLRWPADKLEFDRHVTALRAQLPAADFDAAWAAGQTMSIEETLSSETVTANS